jgi:hypothetical protein
LDENISKSLQFNSLQTSNTSAPHSTAARPREILLEEVFSIRFSLRVIPLDKKNESVWGDVLSSTVIPPDDKLILLSSLTK